MHWRNFAFLIHSWQRNGADFSVYIVSNPACRASLRLNDLRILAKNLMARTQAQGRTKRCPGARFEREPNQ